MKQIALLACLALLTTGCQPGQTDLPADTTRPSQVADRIQDLSEDLRPVPGGKLDRADKALADFRASVECVDRYHQDRQRVIMEADIDIDLLASRFRADMPECWTEQGLFRFSHLIRQGTGG